MFTEQFFSELFIQYAYSPMYVYGGVILFMTLSSFGLPIPEELVLISCGFICYMVSHPDLYPPSSVDAIGVNPYILAFVCFFAVLLSDLLVFLVGKYFGKKLFETKFFKKHISQKHLATVGKWYEKYGALVCGVFRFTPGLRFPGHMSCGMMGVKLWKFLMVDGFAALISVPTQVLLVAEYGKVILEKIKEFKIILGIALVIFLIIHFLRKFYFSKKKV